MYTAPLPCSRLELVPDKIETRPPVCPVATVSPAFKVKWDPSNPSSPFLEPLAPDVPPATMILPPLSVTAKPVDSSKEPDEPTLVVPVVIFIAPEIPLIPASLVLIAILPLVDFPLLPLAKKILPPVPPLVECL